MNRRIKIQEKVKPLKQRYKKVIYPTLKLEGKWLQEAGFDPHTYVKINMLNNKLIIERE